MKKKEELGIKIVSEREKFWETVLIVAEKDIKDAKNSIELNEEVIKIAEVKVKECT